jgi:hypothetical protein
MTKRLIIFALSAVTFAVAPQALKAADEALCPLGNETLHGNYMSRGMGTRVVGPITAVGRIDYDGQGNFVNPTTASVNGVISTSTEIGTYTVNSDCTGSEVATDGAHYNFVITPDGSRFDWISTVPGRVVSGTAIRLTRRLDDVLCPLGNETLHGNYISRATGTIVGVGPITAVGRIDYDGQGSFVNPFTASVNGVISEATEIGTYTVNSDCTGSVVATDGAHYNFVITPDGSRFDWIDTDPGRVFSGTAIRLTRRLEDD